MSADRPLFVDWSAHCAGEWRPFAGATLVADAGGERTHPVSWVALGSHANLPAAGDRATALVALRPARRDVRAPARRAPSSARRDAGASATAWTTRSASTTAPGAGAPQAFPLALVNRITWPMTFPGIWGGRERIEVGPAEPRARLVAADARRCRSSGATRSRRSSATPGAAAAADGATLRTATLRGCRFPAFPRPGASPLPRSARPRRSRRTTPTPPVRGPTTSSPRCARSRRATATS